MFKVFFVVFIVAPLLELYVLIEVGSVIGALPTILLTIFTAGLGAFFMKHQGIQVVKQAQLSMRQGEPPQQQVVEGMLVFIGGVALLLPGLVTDLMGFLVLVPPIRAYLAKRWLLKRGAMQGANAGYVHAEWTVRDTETGRIAYYQEVTKKRYASADTDAGVIEGEVVEDKSKPDSLK
ncbi:FxsA family protein [Thiomicrospira microaerophila]|uniref:FxsA family protein n=1 Tax=Thiomicrospira microaerophila TaxID=406020 RepID=UPI0005C8D803|nr:FxsA family protein [Thiomicrospira microaerophila]